MKMAVLVGNRDNVQYFTKCDFKIREWIVARAKDSRVFAHRGRYVIASKNGKNPYDEMMSHLFIEVAGLWEKEPLFYFDIEKHSSGVDIIKLQPGKTYNCNIVSEVTSGGPLPDGGKYSDKKSAFVMSLLAYKNCFDILKNQGDMGKATEFARRYTVLLESQDQDQMVFYFGDAV